MNFIVNIQEQNKLTRIIAGILLIAIIGILDYLTGYEYAFSLFYVLPIVFITWHTNLQFGLLASLASAIIWLEADIRSGNSYSNAFIPVWNTLIRFAFFAIITTLLSILMRLLEKERELARIDHLTGAINSRFFYEVTQVEIYRLHRYEHPFTLAYFDIDNFKALNDQFGHLSGDQALQVVASSVQKHVRKNDILARLGGDEFALLLPHTNQDSARSALQKIQNELLKEMQRNNWPITFSIGVLTCRFAPSSTDELIKIVDELMYLVKREGKNSIIYSTYDGSYPVPQHRK